MCIRDRFSVSFDGEVDDPRAEAAMDEIRAELADYDTSIYTEVGYDSSADLQSEMSVIIVIAAVIIVLVLTLTSRSYEMCIRDRIQVGVQVHRTVLTPGVETAVGDQLQNDRDRVGDEADGAAQEVGAHVQQGGGTKSHDEHLSLIHI